MARLPRFKVDGAGAWYHLYAKTAAYHKELPLEKPHCRRKLMDLIQHYSNAYFCQVASFCIMGNHYHIVVQFEDPYELTSDELMERAKRLYPRSEKFLRRWTDEQWERLAERLFDVSEFMRNIQMAFARWYNDSFSRQGRFWSDRFKSVVLGSGKSQQDCMIYVDLNPVRAGLVQRPEKWEYSSAYLREIKKADWLLPIREVLGLGSDYRMYKSMLYYRGLKPTKQNQAAISQKIVEQEESRGFKERGVYLKQFRYFRDGIFLGSAELIEKQLKKLRKNKTYLRRKNAIENGDGHEFSLREQRAHAVP